VSNVPAPLGRRRLRGSAGTPPTPPVPDVLLLEDGFALLLESGDNIVLETSP
jgi:hypothetical protein